MMDKWDILDLNLTSFSDGQATLQQRHIHNAYSL